MWTTLSFTLFLLSMASPTASNILADRSIFTGGDVLAHNICDASMTSCNWETGNSWCCPLSTVCDGIGGGGYCCPTSDDCGPEVDADPRCADPTWSLWMGAGTGTHNIDGDGILPKYFCCLGDEFGLVNDTCVANTVVLAAGEKATLVTPGSESGTTTTTTASGTGPTQTATSTTKGGIIGDITSAIGSTHTGDAGIMKVQAPFLALGVVGGVFGLELI